MECDYNLIVALPAKVQETRMPIHFLHAEICCSLFTKPRYFVRRLGGWRHNMTACMRCDRRSRLNPCSLARLRELRSGKLKKSEARLALDPHTEKETPPNAHAVPLPATVACDRSPIHLGHERRHGGK